MRALRNLERKYLPNLRLKKWYKLIKAIIVIPFLLPTYLIKRGFYWLVSKVKIKRNGKPDIVLQNIVDGWINLMIPDPVTEELATKRAAICAQCPFAEMSTGVHTIVVDNKTKNIRGTKCGKCGCPLSAKVRSKNDRCPVGKW